MNGTQLNSDTMTPKKTVSFEVWYCRHCKAEKKIEGKKPERCWNYKCRRMDWDREKIKEGRPRGKAKPKSGQSSRTRRKGRK